MKCSLSSSAFILFVLFLANSCIASRDTTKRDYEDYGSSGISERTDATSEKVEEKQMNGNIFLESQHKLSNDLKETLSKFQDELNDAEEDDDSTEDYGGLGDENSDEEDLTVTDERSSRLRRHCKSRRRKNRKRKEIKRLHEELSHAVEHIEEISEKESELEQEVDELRRRTLTKDFQGRRKYKHAKRNKQLLEMQMPQANDDKYRSIESEIGKELPEPLSEVILDSSDDSSDQRRYSLKQADGERELIEELRDLRKKFRKVLNENRKLRTKNAKLCKQLYETPTPQDYRKYETASTLNLGSNTRPICDNVFGEEEVEDRKKPRRKKNRNHKMADEEDEIGVTKSGFGEKRREMIELNSNDHQKDSGTHIGAKENSAMMRTEKGEGDTTKFTVEDKQKVYDHIASVDEATFCGKPQPVVVYPSDQYPVPNKRYTPQGTILHQCGSHSGCCPNEQLTCVPAKKEIVTLHFFAAVLDGSSSIFPHVEKLQFTNHTKCGCVFKSHAHHYL